MINENRLLIISPFESKVTRPTNQTAIKRNELIAEISDKVFIPYSDDNGNLFHLKKKFEDKLINPTIKKY